MADIRQSAAYARYLTSLGWKIDQGIFIRPLWIFGSIAKLYRGTLPKNWKEILKKHRAWFLQITNSPTKTLRVDLTPSTRIVFSQFKKDCRYTLRKYSGLSAQCSKNNFEKYYGIWKESAKRKSLWIPGQKEYFNLIKCFGKNCFCITINNLAGAVVLIHDHIAYYYYAGATKEGVKQDLPYLVVWECMKEAKKMGCKIWDWEGIYDERWPNKDWKGFSHFKKSFGGYEVEFPGSFIKWF